MMMYWTYDKIHMYCQLRCDVKYIKNLLQNFFLQTDQPQIYQNYVTRQRIGNDCPLIIKYPILGLSLGITFSCSTFTF